MEDRSHIAFQRFRVKVDYLLLPIILLAAATRFYHSFHVLLSDEVFNLVAIETLSSGGGYTDYFFRHPPIYLLISSLFSYLIGPYPQIPSYISIIFSSLSLIPFYLISEQLMGKKVSLYASLFLAVMPANITYSTWIKQDAMLIFFFLWGLRLYLKGHYLFAGAVSGIALLTKEFALFFFPITFFMEAVGGKNWKGWLKTSVTAAVLSSWWYIIFGATFYKVTGEAIIGGNINELAWHFPWWFYFKNIPYDLSYPIFILFLIGILSLVKDLFLRSAGQKGFLVPLLWIGSFYIPLSIITVKAPWYTYLATPPISMIAAFGVANITGAIRWKGSMLGYTVICASLAYALLAFNEDRYIEKVTGFSRPKTAREVHGDTWDEFSMKKDLWRGKMKKGEKVGFLEFIPTLQYLMGLRYEEVVVIKVSRFMALDREGLLKFVTDNGIKAIVLNIDSLTYTEKNLDDMTYLWGRPEKIGNLMVYRTDKAFDL